MMLSRSKIKDAFLFIKCLNSRKIINYTKLRLSFYISNLVHNNLHKGKAFSVSIEPTTSCNLSCSECPSGNKAFSRPTGKIDKEFFFSTIEQLKNHLVYLTLYFQGEPFLHPDFFEMVKYARKNNIYVATSTNAHFLTEKNAELTVKSGLNRLVISLDGIDNETYKTYRKGGNFNTVLQGIRNLCNAKKQMNVSHPFVILQFIVFATNEHQIDDIKRIGKELGVDEVQIKTAQIYDYENGNPLIPENQKYSRYKKLNDGKYIIKKKIKNQCKRMWQSAVICWDGRIVPCCFDKDAVFQLGNLKNQTFNEIWKNQAYHAFRNQIINNRKSIEICCNCTE